MSDVGADVLAEWRVVPENVAVCFALAIVVGSQTPYIYIYINVGIESTLV